MENIIGYIITVLILALFSLIALAGSRKKKTSFISEVFKQSKKYNKDKVMEVTDDKIIFTLKSKMNEEE